MIAATAYIGYLWTEAEVNRRLGAIMTESFSGVVAYANFHNDNNRIATYILASARQPINFVIPGSLGLLVEDSD